MATRIERIIDLEKRAERPEAVADRLRWEAAHLYWQEVTDNGKTKAEIARAIGKSAMHVLYMYRCWERIVMVGKLEYGGDYANLPPFNQVYNSPEVRESDEEREHPEEAGQRRKRRTGSGEEYDLQDILRNLSASGLASCMAICCESLASHPAFWQHLTDDDLASLAMVRDQIRTIIRGSAKLSAQLTQRIQGMNGLSALAAVPFRVKPNYE